ncbi:MAG TPA: cyclase family protein [Thermoanaerobaculia bacterium]|nr:cyclase family protein [Thermoanaerobaculia bacterium]
MRGPLLSGLALTLALVSTAGAAPPEAKAPDLATAKVIDLTHPFDAHTIYWPTSPSAFELKSLAYGLTPGGWFYASNAFCAPEHGGTHLDAPIHFAKDGLTADQIPVRQLVAAAAVLDIRKKAAADPDYRLTLEDVRAWERRHGPIAPGTIVLLETGWSARWPDKKSYLGDDTPGDATRLHFPSYGKEAAEYLVRERRVGALGVDTASIDAGASKDFIVHQIANGAGVPGLENVAHLDALPDTGAWVVALPMKIAGGSGGPLRIVALVP